MPNDERFYDALEREGVEPLYGRYLREGPRRGDGAYANSPELRAIGWLHETFPSHQRHMALERVINIKHTMVETDTFAPKLKTAAPLMLRNLELAMRKRKPEENQGISAFARGARGGEGLVRRDETVADDRGFGMREMMADVAEFKAARLRKNREYEGLVKEKEIRGMDKVKWAPNAQNRALDDLLESFDKAAPDVPKTPDIGDLTAPSARAGNLRPPSRGASTPGSGSSRPPTGGSSRPNSRGDNARIRELRKASRAANFAATLRAGVDSQGAFR